ncbi:MAG: hypothetical protein WAM70_08620, partial [Pyrinomonadaceae bacterium]
PVAIKLDVAQLDLILRLTESGQSILGSLEYRTDLFDTSTISRMLRTFGRLLDELIMQPDARLSVLVATLTEAEKQERDVEKKELKQSLSYKLKTRRRASINLQDREDAEEKTSTEEVLALVGGGGRSV